MAWHMEEATERQVLGGPRPGPKRTWHGEFVGRFSRCSHESPTLAMYERIIASPTVARIDLVA
jgi:hypothetical protein